MPPTFRELPPPDLPFDKLDDFDNLFNFYAETQEKELRKKLKHHATRLRGGNEIIAGVAVTGRINFLQKRQYVTLKSFYKDDVLDVEKFTEVWTDIENVRLIGVHEEQIILADRGTLEIVEIIGL